MREKRILWYAALLTVFLVSAASAQINWTTHTIDPLCVSPRYIHPVDIDGDGDIDIIGANENQINLYENNGYQIFWKSTVDPSFIGAQVVWAADMDGDDDLDILAGGGTEDHIALYLNDGNENFTYSFLGFFNNAKGVHAVDMDDDDDMDVVAASSPDDKVSWFENISGIFMEHIIGTLDNPYYSVSIDVGNDDDYDVFACAYTADVVNLYVNDGNQSFTTVLVGSLDGAYCIGAGDLDGDNDIDCAAVAYTAQTVVWYENNGSNAFTLHTVAVAVYMPRFIDVCDIDNDLDLDLLVAGYGDSYILIYLNNGSGVFTEELIDYYYPWVTVGSDVDSDGDTDILTASYYGYYLDWLESDLTGAFPLILNVTPENPPVQVPPGGGNFNYDLELLNNSTSQTFIVDMWMDVLLPNNYIYPLLQRNNITMSPNDTLFRAMTQFVPGNAMPGWYTYMVHIRDHNTWQVYLEESFDFEKLEGADSPNHNQGWQLYGWEGAFAGSQLPSEYSFQAPYPNPFNPSANLTFALKDPGYTTLIVYNIEGKEVTRLVEGWRAAGAYQVQFDGAGLSSGIYFAKLTSEDFVKVHKLLLTK